MPREEKMDKEVADNLCLCDFCKSHLAPAASVAQPFPALRICCTVPASWRCLSELGQGITAGCLCAGADVELQAEILLSRDPNLYLKCLCWSHKPKAFCPRCFG